MPIEELIDIIYRYYTYTIHRKPSNTHRIRVLTIRKPGFQSPLTNNTSFFTDQRRRSVHSERVQEHHLGSAEDPHRSGLAPGTGDVHVAQRRQGRMDGQQKSWRINGINMAEWHING